MSKILKIAERFERILKVADKANAVSLGNRLQTMGRPVTGKACIAYGLGKNVARAKSAAGQDPYVPAIFSAFSEEVAQPLTFDSTNFPEDVENYRSLYSEIINAINS